MQSWQPPAPPDANTFRIFISTDNHLGFNERIEYMPRQDDSFRAVEEVLENATASKVSSFTTCTAYLCTLFPCPCSDRKLSVLG